MANAIYLLRNQSTHGPYEDSVVSEMLRKGQCSLKDLACREGVSEWRPLGTLIPLQEVTAPFALTKDRKAFVQETWLTRKRTILWKFVAFLLWSASCFGTMVLTVLLVLSRAPGTGATEEEKTRFAHWASQNTTPVGGFILIVMVVGWFVIISRASNSK